MSLCPGSPALFQFLPCFFFFQGGPVRAGLLVPLPGDLRQDVLRVLPRLDSGGDHLRAREGRDRGRVSGRSGDDARHRRRSPGDGVRSPKSETKRKTRRGPPGQFFTLQARVRGMCGL
jgi:hypothetical protein